MRVAQVATQAARSSLSDVFRARKQGVRLPPGAKANIVTAVGLKTSATTPAVSAEQSAKPAHPTKAAPPPHAAAAEASTAGALPPAPRPQRRKKADTKDITTADTAVPMAKLRRKRITKKAAGTDAVAAEPDILAGMEAAAAAPPPLPPLSLESVRVGCAHLSAAHSGLAALIREHGPPEKLVMKDGHTFESLARSIVSQQLATGAARTIYGRFQTACKCEGEVPLQPEAVLATPLEQLRACGLSGAKASYVLDLASHYADGRITCNGLKGMAEEQLIEELTKVKGIGRWTADMFAMFFMGRPDVLPVGDLGVRKGFQVLFKLKDLPDAAKMEKLSQSWRPWRSIASYYMWRVAEADAASRKAQNASKKKSKAAS